MIEFAPESEKIMTYEEAILYCQFLEYDGHTDWRLPTWSEYINNSNTTLNAWFDGSMSQLSWYAHPVRAIC